LEPLLYYSKSIIASIGNRAEYISSNKKERNLEMGLLRDEMTGKNPEMVKWSIIEELFGER